jgi:hypothetical protein
MPATGVAAMIGGLAHFAAFCDRNIPSTDSTAAASADACFSHLIPPGPELTSGGQKPCFIAALRIGDGAASCGNAPVSQGITCT